MSLLNRPFGNSAPRQFDRPATAAVVNLTAATASRLREAATGQRLRLGLTGLAAVFLLVMVAAAGMKPRQSMAPTGATGEPLAVLGVAPGAGPAGAVDNPAPPPARPSRT